MSFLYPGVLWFLLLLAIPVIIHLFNLRKYRKVYFSNVSFLQNIKATSRSRLTVKQWLALIARLLALAMLVLAFAVPYIKNTLLVNTEARQVIFLDNSHSNSNVTKEGISILDRSLQSVSQYLSGFEPEDRFIFSTNNYTSRTPLSPAQVTEQLTDTELTDQRITLSALKKEGKTNYLIFSDFQKNQYSTESMAADTSATYYLFPAYYESGNNIYVDTISLENPVLNSFTDNKINVRLKNTGTADVTDLQVYFSVNNIQQSANTIDISAGSFTDLEINISSLTEESNNCVIRFEDFPVTFDNEFFFTLTKVSKVQILDLRGDKSTDYFRKVFGTELFNLQSADPKNMNYARLDETDMVILNEISGLNPNLQTVLIRYVENGGSLLMVPGGNTADAGFLSRISAGSVSPFTSTQSQRQNLAEPATDNPFFSGVFDKQTSRMDNISSRYLYNWRHGETILAFRSGIPFLSRFRRKNGQVYILNSSMDTRSSGFAESALFLPVMYKVAFSSPSAGTRRIYYRNNSNSISINSNTSGSEEVLALVKKDQRLIPLQRKLKGDVVLDISNLNIEPGFWQVCQQQDCLETIAVNRTQAESLTVQYNRDQLKELADAQPHVFLVNTNRAGQSGSDAMDGFRNKYLWKYALLLALVFFFAEVLILRFL